MRDVLKVNFIGTIRNQEDFDRIERKLKEYFKPFEEEIKQCKGFITANVDNGEVRFTLKDLPDELEKRIMSSQPDV